MKKWKGRLRVYFQDGSVKRPEVVLGLCSQMSKSEARTKLREMIRQNGDRPSPILHDITFGEYWRDHYIPLRRSGWSEPTEAGYKGYMKFLILPSMEHVALKDIDHVLLANYFAGPKGRCGYWTMKKIRMLLKSIFEEAVNDDLIAKNPMRRESTGTTADLYVVEIPDEVRRTQERYAAEIDALRAPNKRPKAERKPPVRKRSTAKLDATGRTLSSRMAVSY